MYAIKNLITEETIHVDTKKLVIKVNDKIINDSNVILIEILKCIISHSPNVVPYQVIIDSVLRKYDVACHEVSDSIGYIRKKKWELTTTFDSLNIPKVIDTIRVIGYRLNTKWVKQELVYPKSTPILEEKRIQEIINEIGKLLDNVINLSEQLILIATTNEDNQTILRLDKEKTKNEIDIIMNNFILISKELLISLNLSPFEYKYIKVYRILKDIDSYVCMDRIGTNISEDKWRQLFYFELHSLFERLCASVFE